MTARRVLIVDDNRDLAENLAEILEYKGFEADFFDRPRRAVDTLVPGRYAVALLDIRMPEMDGIELYRHLREKDPGLPAIAMTAYTRDERLRDALEAGMLCVLPKPVDVPALLARLAATASGDRALVVDDDGALLQNLCELLSERGFTPHLARSCAEARGIYATTPIAVVLSDIRLPDGNDLDLVEELLAQRPTQAIVFTAYGRELPQAKARAEAAGARYFEKPLAVERLLAALGAPSPRAPA